MTSVKILNNSDNPNPEYKTPGAAGFDLAISEDLILNPSEVKLAPTGLKVIIPNGYEGQIRLRSSMYKKNILVPNAPGTIDSDYRGEVFIPLRNVSLSKVMAFKKGERIAQMIIKEVPQIELHYLNEDQFNACSSTLRGDGGFGSTGEYSDATSL
jgi:dUTP pyrophosphatase